MNFEFSKNFQGFTSSQRVDMNLISYHSEPALLCRCRESCDLPGVIRKINLPSLGEYVLKMDIQVDNHRTYLSVTDLRNQLIIPERIYLSKKRNEVEVKFYARSNQIVLGIFMGGDSIAIPDNKFIIFNIRLALKRKPDANATSEFKITRVFETVNDLERERNDPLRSNQTPMEVGEYAILRTDTKQLNDDLYVLSHRGLKYVARIGPGRPSFFGEAFFSIPGKEIPVYADPAQAQKDLNANRNEFYRPNDNYEWKNNSEENIYLYLDDQGYVRWLKYSKSEQLVEKEKELAVEKEKLQK